MRCVSAEAQKRRFQLNACGLSDTTQHSTKQRRYFSNKSHRILNVLYIVIVLKVFVIVLPTHFILSALSENSQQIVPRASRYSHITCPSQEYFNPVGSRHPFIHAVMIIQSPCYTSLTRLSFSALTRQSRPPNRITVVHACSVDHEKAFRLRIRHHLQSSTKKSIHVSSLNDILSFHRCLRMSDGCVLDFLLVSNQHIRQSQAPDLQHCLILSESMVFEPSAIEKLFISLSLRPKVLGFRIQAYNASSIQKEDMKNENHAVPATVPYQISTHEHSNSLLPFYFDLSVYGSSHQNVTREIGSNWNSLIKIISKSRAFREPLYTNLALSGQSENGIFSYIQMRQNDLPPHLFQDIAFYKNSAQLDMQEMYLQFPSPKTSISRILSDSQSRCQSSAGNDRTPHMILIAPGLRLDDIGRTVLDISDKVINRRWGLTIILTEPLWREDLIGELFSFQPLLNTAQEYSSDIFDLSVLSPHYLSTKVLQYIMETRAPDYVLMLESKWALHRIPLIRMIIPNTLLADVGHSSGTSSLSTAHVAAAHTNSIDLHIRPSKNSSLMLKKISNDVQLSKIHVCQRGFSRVILAKHERENIRLKQRKALEIPSSSLVVLFYQEELCNGNGHLFLKDIILKVVESDAFRTQLRFIVLTNYEDDLCTMLPRSRFGSVLLKHDCLDSFSDIKENLAVADIFLSLSKTRQARLLIHEAMLTKVLVVSIHDDSIEDIVSEQTAFIIPREISYQDVISRVIQVFGNLTLNTEKILGVLARAQSVADSQHHAYSFSDCILENLWGTTRAVNRTPKKSLWYEEHAENENSYQYSKQLSKIEETERAVGRKRVESTRRSLEGLLTVGIKAHVCHMDVPGNLEVLVRSIRLKYERIKVLIANDGPIKINWVPFIRTDPFVEELHLPLDSGLSFGRNVMVNYSTTEFFFLLDDDQELDRTTDFWSLIDGIRYFGYDIVGVRMRNHPGMPEYEKDGILLSRFASNITAENDGNLTLCVWNENQGPSVYGLRNPLPVHTVLNAFMASVKMLRKHPWRNELKVNEHMAFFYDAKHDGVKVGYLPSVFINHTPRKKAPCYREKRYREESFRSLLPFKEYDAPNRFTWDLPCSANFPKVVEQHIKESRERYGVNG